MNQDSNETRNMLFRVEVVGDLKEYALPEGITHIGREKSQKSNENNIVVGKKYNLVSRSHAEIEIQGDKCLLTDIGSRNHSYILLRSGKWVQLKASEPYEVLENTEIRLGGPYPEPKKGQYTIDMRIVVERLSARAATAVHEQTED